jgi:hypothetical protein
MTTNDGSVRTVRLLPTEDLAGSVRQSLADLGKISEQLDAGVVPGMIMATQLETLAGEIRAAAAVAGGSPDDGTSAVRGLLAAIVEALDIPGPAGPDAERAYLRIRSERAGEVVRACANVLETSSDPTARNWSWSASWLRTAAADHSTGAYQHEIPAGPAGGYIS